MSFGKKNSSGKQFVWLVTAVGIGLAIVPFVRPEMSANAGYGPPPAPPVVQPPKPPVVLPPPTQPPPFRPPLTVPTDAVNTLPTPLRAGTEPVDSSALVGLTQLRDFPTENSLRGPTDFILVKDAPGAAFRKLTEYMVEHNSGQILVGVRKPSLMGMVSTPYGRIAITSPADALITYSDGVLRIANPDGMGTNLKVNLGKGPFAGDKGIVVAIAPGYELTAADRKLTRADLRPSDGVLRRTPTIIGEGNVAVSQFNVESLLHSSSLIASMNQQAAGSKEKRVLADMSRMAAVLNHIHGTEGYAGN